MAFALKSSVAVKAATSRRSAVVVRAGKYDEELIKTAVSNVMIYSSAALLTHISETHNWSMQSMATQFTISQLDPISDVKNL